MHRSAVLRVWATDPWRHFQGGWDTQNYYYKTKMLFAFFIVFTFALMAKAVVSETVGALAQSQTATAGG